MDEAHFQSLQTALIERFADRQIDELLAVGTRLWEVAGATRRAAPSPFPDDATLQAWAQELGRRRGVRIDRMCGAAGGTLVVANLAACTAGVEAAGELYRWHCLLPPLCQEGALFSLRRHRFEVLGLDAFDMARADRERLLAAAAARRPVLLAGPTGSGKTTLLAALLRFYASDERVVIVESVAELPTLSPSWIRLLERRPNLEGVGAFGLTRLIHEALRLRPDRLVVGEVRGTEASGLAEALLTGHGGVMATVHAGAASEAVARLTSLLRAGGRDGGALDVELTVAVLGRSGASGQSPRVTSVQTGRLTL